MQCQQCQFENVPARTRCLRCGSVLVAIAVAAADIYPPRMAVWGKPLRSALRWMRLHNLPPGGFSPAHAAKQMRVMSPAAFVALVLSVFPGLAHLIDRRFKEIRGYVLAWFIMLASGIFLYGGTLGFLLLALAVSLHAWIAFSHTLNKELSQSNSRFVGLAILLVLTTLFYWGIRKTVFDDFVWGYTNLNIPYYHLEKGNCLLARYSRAHDTVLSRGSLVLARLHTFGRGFNYSPYRMIVQIVGLEGEKVEIAANTFLINDKPLDSDKFPVPKWLQNRTTSVVVPADYCFVGCEYNIDSHGMTVPDKDVISVCLLPKRDIEARAIMRWLPLRRRGFLEEIE